MERQEIFLGQSLKQELLLLLSSSRCFCTFVCIIIICNQVPWHPDPSVRLQGVSRLAASRLSKEALANPATIIPKGPAYQFRGSKPAAGGTETAGVIEATAVLRLLHIQDLRVLQTQINEAIVAVQKVVVYLSIITIYTNLLCF